VLRFVGHDHGWVIGWPCVVVRDDAECVVLWTAAGTPVSNRQFNEHDERGRLQPESKRDWPATCYPPAGLLRYVPQGAAHAVEARFSGDAM
jgi:hypothetical protein